MLTLLRSKSKQSAICKGWLTFTWEVKFPLQSAYTSTILEVILFIKNPSSLERRYWFVPMITRPDARAHHLPSTQKRKRTTEHGDSKQSEKTKPSMAPKERHEQKLQYLQWKSSTELPRVGCGWNLLGSRFVPSQTPIDDQIKLEISSGTQGDESDSIRFYPP